MSPWGPELASFCKAPTAGAFVSTPAPVPSRAKLPRASDLRLRRGGGRKAPRGAARALPHRRSLKTVRAGAALRSGGPRGVGDCAWSLAGYGGLTTSVRVHEMPRPSNRAIRFDGPKCVEVRARNGFSRERLAAESRGGLSL